mgnify:CR=1 FL=1
MVTIKASYVGVLFVLITSISVFSGKAQQASPDIRQIEKSLVKITDSLYAGKYEVSNNLYSLFIKYLKANNKADELKVAAVDSANWRDKLAYNEPYADYYHSHPAYTEYPVVNISYDAAVLFCKWLTDQYNAYPKRRFQKIVFRLPTNKEWTYAARGDSSDSPYPWGIYLIKDCKYMCNFRHFGDERVTFRKDLSIYEIVKNPGSPGSFEYADIASITAPVFAYEPNKLGLYNVCGNVAEMVSMKGKTRGGSYKNSGWDVRIDASDNFTKSATDIGFRYFMEIIEK